MIRKKERKDFLIALMPDKNDLEILHREKWYRIRIGKRSPKSIRENFIKYIAFYQPGSFDNDAFIIRWWAKVRAVTKATRKELFPSGGNTEKNGREYYKVGVTEIEELPEPIFCRRPRRILFINTTYEQFTKAREINDLFIESPIEEKFWSALKENNIIAERQFPVSSGKKRYRLDFALFCKERKLAIECDGDRYHTSKEDVFKDKKRSNVLESKGWNVLRYTTKDINYHLESSIAQVKETVNRYGGLEESDNNFRYLYSKDDQQERLFQ